MCCDTTNYALSEINGNCFDCGQPTCNGSAYEACGYSPIMCDTCGYAPCDESC